MGAGGWGGEEGKLMSSWSQRAGGALPAAVTWLCAVFLPPPPVRQNGGRLRPPVAANGGEESRGLPGPQPRAPLSCSLKSDSKARLRRAEGTQSPPRGVPGPGRAAQRWEG